MTITLYDFSKRKNSTAQPTSAGTDASVTLKEGTSIESPVFLLTGNNFDVNYVKAFGHYYFVTDVRSIRNDLREISCRMDALATHKTEIGNYTALIERSDSFYDPSYPDPAVSMMNELYFDDAVGDPDIYDDDGYFVLSVLNNVGSGTGFTSNYVVSSATLQRIAKFVNTDWGSAATDLLAWFKSVFLKTANSIIDCIWLPLKTTALTGLSIVWEKMVIGVTPMSDADGDIDGGKMTATCVVHNQCTATIPHHYTNAGDFRRCAPYTVGKIFIPGYGYADFNPLDFEPTGVITITTDIDVSTGDTVVYLSNADGVLVSTYTFNIGVSCPVGKVGANVTETIGGILSTASNIALFNKTTPGSAAESIADYASAASMVNTISSAAGATASYSGRKAGRAIWNNNTEYYIAMFAHETQAVDSMETTSGRPDMTERAINTCSGYVKCINASVPIAGMDAERDEINSYLNNGFYYE